MISIKDLAALAETSVASVSRVINKKPGVNPEVRARIERLIVEHDYRPNLIARELLQKRTRLVGILLPTIHSYYADRIAGIIDVCRDHHYGTMIASARENVEEEIENFDLMSEKQVEGIIFFAATLDDRHLAVMRLIARTIPIVCVGQEVDIPGVSSVVSDNYAGAAMAMEYLIGQGHRDIAFIGGPDSNLSARQRFQAYSDALKSAGIPPRTEWLRQGDFTMPSGYRETLELLDSGNARPSAVFYCNDMMAIGGFHAFQKQGVSVPDDISVVGFDDINYAEYTIPPLTTVHQNHYDVGRQAGDLLMSMRQNTTGENRRIILEQSLIVRESVRSIP
jgi:Transcriptional regulators